MIQIDNRCSAILLYKYWQYKIQYFGNKNLILRFEQPEFHRNNYRQWFSLKIYKKCEKRIFFISRFWFYLFVSLYLPIWTPACPTWIEMTSRMLKKRTFQTLIRCVKSCKVEWDEQSKQRRRGTRPAPPVGARLATGNHGDEDFSRLSKVASS